jgi:predicted ribonuclease toxin of YeeF-YezG toxin-antitoxin module
MWGPEIEAHWQQLIDDVMTGMKEWRIQHPRASFQEIESALDEKLAKVRARMLQDIALASKAAKASEQEHSERAKCPECSQPMEARGEETRTLLTNYNQPIKLTRSYAYCPACQAGLFPPR